MVKGSRTNVYPSAGWCIPTTPVVPLPWADASCVVMLCFVTDHVSLDLLQADALAVAAPRDHLVEREHQLEALVHHLHTHTPSTTTHRLHQHSYTPNVAS